MWFRLVARQAGRLIPVNADDRSHFYVASPADKRACRQLDKGRGVRFSAGEEALLFVARPAAEERAVADLTYAPLAMNASDCAIATDTARPNKQHVECDNSSELAIGFLAPVPSSLSVAVDVTSDAAPAINGCPRVVLSGISLEATDCPAAAATSARYSLTYRAVLPIAAGPWNVAVCASTAAAKVTDVRVSTSTLAPGNLDQHGQAPASAQPLLVPLDSNPQLPCETSSVSSSGAP